MGNLIIVMGVSGCGKSTIGHALSRELKAPFLEGDDFHPKANKDKMRSATPLTDLDRADWISAILSAANRAPEAVLILACSALTPYVQQRLTGGTQRDIHWLHLTASPEFIRERLQNRKGHFMPEVLLGSQYAALSAPKGAITLNAAQSVEACLAEIMQKLPTLD